MADLTITSKREEAVDFTHPFMNTGISILFKKPTQKITSLFSFLSPFSNIVWLYVVGAYVGVSTMLFIVGRLSPYEWENPHPCRKDDQVLENGFSLSNAFWFTIGSLMQQGSDLSPKYATTPLIPPSHPLESKSLTLHSLQSDVHSNYSRNLVFFHTDNDRFLYRKFGRISDGRENNLPDRERRGFGRPGEHQIWLSG